MTGLDNDGSGLVVDLFAGPGGWSEGLRMLGLSDVGVEWEASACRTRAAAGHATIRADVAALPRGPFAGKAFGLIGSPPCVSYSMAGTREGIDALPELCAVVEKAWQGADPTGLSADATSALVLQPVLWARDLGDRCRWICLEQVAGALPVWQAMAIVLREHGWSTWSGVLNSADYGVPQARKRAVLIACLDRVAAPPPATHSRDGTSDGDTLFGPSLDRWVPLSAVVDVPDGTGVYRRTAGGFERIDHLLPAPTVKPISPHGGAPRFDDLVKLVSSEPRLTNDQAKDLTGGQPSTARVTVAENAALQTFPVGYPWQGNTIRQYEQIGNAVPPLLAAHVVAAAAGRRPPVLVPG